MIPATVPAVDPVHAALAALVLSEVLLPSWVYYDAKKQDIEDAHRWIHAVLLPVFNVFGVLAYVDRRRRALAEREEQVRNGAKN